MNDLSVQDRRYRPVLRAANWAASAIDALGLPLTNLDESVLRAARRSTGLSDWGDEGFLVAFHELQKSVHGAGFTPLGKIIVRLAWMQALSNRLRFQAFVDRHPDVLETPVERPVFVLGFPRTGTTALQHLLCLEPRRRGLEFWELTNPIPVHEDPAVDARRRIRSAQRMLSAAYLMAPEMREVHYINATTLEECWPLFANSFSVLNWDLQSGLKDFGHWLMTEHDMVGAYREYKRYLQLLLWRRPADNLVLKCPEHLWFLDELLEVFPDACVVWTHRDPYDTIASYCSLISMQYRTLYGEFDPKEIGRHITERFLRGVRRAMSARAHHDPDRFFDMPFSSLVVDQAGAVRDITSHFGLPCRPGTDARVAEWLDSRHQDARGKHKYTAETYGLDLDAIHARYAEYIESFSVTVRAA